jgi:hypothetical protein
MNILDEINKDSLRKFLVNCSKYADIDVELAYNITLNCIADHDGKEVEHGSMSKMEELFRTWYSSLSTNPDYTVYEDPYYFCEVWVCWVKYSRKHLKTITSKNSLSEGISIVDSLSSVNSILDLGCGFGYTTTGFKQLFPNSTVYGTNIEGCSQFKMATELGNVHGFSILPTFEHLEVDLIFASEYFEHFLEPIDHLLDVLLNCKPNYLLIANAFTADAIGHFDTYNWNNKEFTGKQISKIFNDTLRQHGYEKVKTNCWNDRPTFWKKSTGGVL